MLELRELVYIGQTFTDWQIECDVMLMIADDSNKIEFQLVELFIMESVKIFTDQIEQEFLVQNIERFFNEYCQTAITWFKEVLKSKFLAKSVIIVGTYLTIASIINS